MNNWKKIKKYFTPDGSLIDIFLREYDKQKWILLIAWLRVNQHVISINFYDPISGNNIITFSDNILDLIGKPGFYFHINLKYDELIIAFHYFDINELEIDINREAINSEQDFKKLIEIIDEICICTDSKYYKICPEGAKDFIIYDNNGLTAYSSN